MPSLRLSLESQVVDLAVRWTREEELALSFVPCVAWRHSSAGRHQEKLRSFKLRGWNDLAADLLAEDAA